MTFNSPMLQEILLHPRALAARWTGSLHQDIPRNRVSRVCVAAAFLLCGDALPQIHAEETVQQILIEFEHESTRIEKPLEDLKSFYLKHLEGLRERFKSEGNLEAVIAAEEEIKVPGSSSTAARFPDLKQAQEQYGQNTRKLTESCITNRQQLVAHYLAKLGPLQTELTKQGKVEEAKSVLRETDRLMKIAAELELDRQHADLLTTTVRPSRASNFAHGQTQDITETAFIIESDQNRSVLALEFQHKDFGTKLHPISEATLILTVLRNSTANTSDQIRVIHEEKMIGSKRGAAHGETIRIPLSVEALQEKPVIKLTVACGKDALVVSKLENGPQLFVRFDR